jgi:hypothetical protein
MLGGLLVWLCVATPLTYITLNINWRAILEWIFS